jgi:hypothetical protein
MAAPLRFARHQPRRNIVGALRRGRSHHNHFAVFADTLGATGHVATAALADWRRMRNEIDGG